MALLTRPRALVAAGGIAVIGLLVAPTAVAAQEAGGLPLWEVGVFTMGVSQQAYPGADQQLNRALLLPYAIYRGEVFRADRSGVGVRKVLSPAVELDLGFAAAFGSRSNEIEARTGMPELGTLVEFGPRIQWTLGQAPGNARLRADFAVRGVFDVADRMTDKGVAFEPKLVYERNSTMGWRYSVGAGLMFADQRLADTLYGVAQAYATPTRSAYAAQSGLVASRLSLSVSRAMTPNLRLSAFTRVDSVGGAANQNSPLVNKNTGATTGLLLTYTLAQSQTLVRD